MKIIASDFDGTIYKWRRISDADRNAVLNWQKMGNAFGIVTGRGKSILNTAKEHGIALDYAVVLNGAQVYDRDGKLLYEEYFDVSIAEDYYRFADLYHPTQKGGIDYALHDPSAPATPENIKGGCQLSLLFDTDEEANTVANLLNEKFGDTIVSYSNGRNINTVKAGVSKATGIAAYARIAGVKDEDIYVIGDSYNDLPMLTAYDGYCVNSACEDMKSRVRNHVEDMTELTEIAYRRNRYRYLYENLRTRQPLRFREDGTFKILTYSDLHAKNDYSPLTIKAVRDMVEHVKPDLVLINGDIIHHIDGESKEDICEKIHVYLKDVMAVLEEKGIPWAHVFGNHDDNCGVDNSETFPLYAGFEHCLSKRGPEDISGTGNYVLPVWNHDGSGIALNIWGMSTRCHEPIKGKESSVLPEYFVNGTNDDVVRFDQQMWYWQSSVELEQYAGYKVPGIVYFHIPLPECMLVPKNPIETKMHGTFGERMGCPELNTGFFATMLQRGDMIGVLCGHEHFDDYDGVYCGLHLCFDGALTFDGYSKDTTRGARVMEFHEDDIQNYNTYMVHLKDIWDKES